MDSITRLNQAPYMEIEEGVRSLGARSPVGDTASILITVELRGTLQQQLHQTYKEYTVERHRQQLDYWPGVERSRAESYTLRTHMVGGQSSFY
jgi:uncharacterized protein YlxW (UPF0749 family)